MGGGDLNLKKSWHPHTMKNQERVWKAEQAKQEEQRKLDDLRKEINEERDREELRRIGENSGVLASSSAGGGEAKLEWMYKNSAELINREEYLLGRKIDKSFEQLQAEERRQEYTSLGVKQSINHVEHECVPFSIREYRNLQSTEQVDMQRKTMEDPLMLIKQREMESRRKLLENPVKLKEIHRILKTEQEQATKHNKKSKNSKTSKKKKHKKDASDDDCANDDLDRKLARQMKKLKGGATNGDFKLDKLLDAKYRTLTKQLDMAAKQKKTKKKSKRRSDKSDESSESSEEEPAKESKGKSDKRNSSEDRCRERRGRRDGSKSSDTVLANRSRENRGTRGRSHSSHNERNIRRERQEVSRQPDASKSQRKQSRSRSPRRDQQQQRQRSRSLERQRARRSQRSRERQRRSRTPEKQRKQQRRSPSPAARRLSPPPAQRQTAKHKQKLSEEDREARLREMMDNATWREADRTKAVHKHREEYAREEAQNQARDFDKQFINKEVKKAIDNQTSIGNRIRSNLNNIQRTSAAMESSFTRK